MCSYAGKNASVNTGIRLRAAYDCLHMAKCDFAQDGNICILKAMNIRSPLNFTELFYVSHSLCSSSLRDAEGRWVACVRVMVERSQQLRRGNCGNAIVMMYSLT